MNDFEVKEIEAKSILTKTKLPDCDYVVNPYIGCRFACVYCYASFMGRFVDKKLTDWGNYVYPKINSAELLKEEIKKLPNRGKDLSLLFSSVTDPYQGLEAKYLLTRNCLEVLADYDFEGTVGILTKSDLVLRDIDLLKRLKHSEVGLTVTSTDDSISRYFEKYAPSVSSRFEALKKLNAEKINTYAIVGPIFPHFMSNPNSLESVFKKIKECGTTEIYVEHINLKKYILDRLVKELPDLDKNMLNKFYLSKNIEYREQLNGVISGLTRKYQLKIRLDEATYHPDL